MKDAERLLALKYGETRIDEGMAYRGGDRSLPVPISLIVYLIEADNRVILVDAGCDDMPGFTLKHFASPVEILRRAGYAPEDVTDLILTHAHYDHAEASHYFKNAVVHIAEEELAAAKRFLPDFLTVQPFKEETCPACGVRAVKIGGHSHGSAVVEVSLGGRTHVICGDECYVRRCLEEKICTGASVCPEKSMAFLEKYGAGDYVTHLCHDGAILPGQNGVWEIKG